nr:hypothetical protein CFP56_71138 [Quercus suber]
MTMLLDVLVSVVDVTPDKSDLVKDKLKLVIHSESISDGGFQMGWTDGDRDKKGGKGGSNKKRERGRGKNK